MSELLTEIEMRENLRVAIDAAGSQKAFAAECCVTPQLISMCLGGSKAITGRVAKRLGYRRAVAYVQIAGGENA
jgi:hypothetical protein